MITADLPGTVPVKEVDDSVIRKVPTPPNEFIVSIWLLSHLHLNRILIGTC